MPEALQALYRLEQAGYIVEAEGPLPDAEALFWNALNQSATTAEQALRAAEISITSLGATASIADLLSASAKGQGIGTSREAPLHVVLTDDYLHSELPELNRDTIERSQSWMLIKPVGVQLWIGPIFSPPATACWACLSHRLRANRQVEEFVNHHAGRMVMPRSAAASLESTAQTAVGLALTEIAKWFVGQPGVDLTQGLVTLDALSLETRYHALAKRPQCAACGQPSIEQRSRPIQLTHRHVPRAEAGQYRFSTASDVLNRHESLVSPITGVVSTLTKKGISTPDFAPAYAAGHCFPTPHRYSSIRELQANLLYRSGGKGATDAQAKASAICEAVERYSAVFWGEKPSVRGSLASLSPDSIHPNECMLFSDLQYETRDDWNSGCVSRMHVVPLPFDEEREIDWSPLWSMNEGRLRYLPTALCFYGHPETSLFFCIPDSNGTASGSCLEEAILYGFLELVERDAVAIWWYNRLRRPAVDLDSFDIPYVHNVRERHREDLHRDLWVLDITSDFGIPAFATITRRIDRPVEDIIVGFGAHLDPEAALLQSIVEANQFLPAVSLDAPDGRTLYLFDKQDAIDWWKTATIESEPYLLPDVDAPPTARSSLRSMTSGDLLTDVELCARIAGDRNLDLLVLDLTRPDIGLNVARVVMPGARHFWRRLAPGRLYEVPTELHWAEIPLPEEGLNPKSVFF